MGQTLKRRVIRRNLLKNIVIVKKIYWVPVTVSGKWRFPIPGSQFVRRMTRKTDCDRPFRGRGPLKVLLFVSRLSVLRLIPLPLKFVLSFVRCLTGPN